MSKRKHLKYIGFTTAAAIAASKIKTMTQSNEEVATCRGCGKVLKGKPYYMGGTAYHPRTNERCKVNFYGGFVCSDECDKRASYELESSMPGNRMPSYQSYTPRNKAK